jgi:hypothetical protein
MMMQKGLEKFEARLSKQLEEWHGTSPAPQLPLLGIPVEQAHFDAAAFQPFFEYR